MRSKGLRARDAWVLREKLRSRHGKLVEDTLMVREAYLKALLGALVLFCYLPCVARALACKPAA